MRLVGLPVTGKIDKVCNPAYCQNQNGNGFKDMPEQVKERFF